MRARCTGTSRRFEDGVTLGLRRCGELAPEGIRSIAVDGWGVDYVRLGEDGLALSDPFCYRDMRTVAAEQYLHRHISPGADARDHRDHLDAHQHAVPAARRSADEPAAGRGWLQLPEYLLYRLGGKPVSEATLAAHTQLVDVDQRSGRGRFFRRPIWRSHRLPNW
jgi:rhamnulokinase